MKTRAKFSMALIAVAIILLFVYLFLISQEPESREKVVVAIVSSLTGNLAENGIDTANGAKMALEDAQQTNMSRFGKFTIKMFDDEADPKVAVSIANRVCEDKSIIAVIGHLTSGCTSAATAVYASSKMQV